MNPMNSGFATSGPSEAKPHRVVTFTRKGASLSPEAVARVASSLIFNVTGSAKYKKVSPGSAGSRPRACR